MFGPHAETIAWLERQLSELEAWRRDLVVEGADEPQRLEQIDLHRTWLEDQILRLASSPFKPAT